MNGKSVLLPPEQHVSNEKNPDLLVPVAVYDSLHRRACAKFTRPWRKICRRTTEARHARSRLPADHHRRENAQIQRFRQRKIRRAWLLGLLVSRLPQGCPRNCPHVRAVPSERGGVPRCLVWHGQGKMGGLRWKNGYSLYPSERAEANGAVGGGRCLRRALDSFDLSYWSWRKSAGEYGFIL